MEKERVGIHFELKTLRLLNKHVPKMKWSTFIVALLQTPLTKLSKSKRGFKKQGFLSHGRGKTVCTAYYFDEKTAALLRKTIPSKFRSKFINQVVQARLVKMEERANRKLQVAEAALNEAS